MKLSRNFVAAAAAAVVSLGLLAVPAHAEPAGSATLEPYSWPEFSDDSQLEADFAALAELVEVLAPQAGVSPGTSNALAVRMRTEPLALVDEFYEDPTGMAGEAGQLVGESASISATVTVLTDGNIGLSTVQTDTITPATSVVMFGDVAVDLFALMHDSASELQATAPGLATTDLSVSPMSISGCTALPTSGGWIRRANCVVYGSTTPALASSSMLVSYSVKSGGGRVDGTPGWNAARCTIGYTTNHSITVIRSLNSGSTPPQARQTWTCVRTGGTVSQGSPWRLDFFA